MESFMDGGIVPPDTSRCAPAPLKRVPPSVCSRVLLYAQGMDMDPVEAVELALESLKRADAWLAAQQPPSPCPESTPNAPACPTPSDSPAAEDDPDAAACIRRMEQQVLDEAMRELHSLLKERSSGPAAPEESIRFVDGKYALRSAPDMTRRAMVPEEMDLTPLRSALKRLFRRIAGNTQAEPSDDSSPRKRDAWERTGNARRLLLLALILIPTILASSIMFTLLPSGGQPVLRLIITALFAVLFAWISVGFWSSAAGFILMLKRFDRHAVTNGLPDDLHIADDARTALLFPVYNEDAHSVAAGVRTVLQSLRRAGIERHFDIFICSDSTSPDAWVREEEAWYAICREENAFHRVFYRRRRMNLKRKSGNIADFCRRWGARYRYMIVFDADSLMTASSLARMVQVMERHPDVGILQTPPKTIRARSLIARAQQFANHLYGPIFAAGLQYWQLGDAQYWGHNAIIRVEPFMRHCQLPTLPGRMPFGGDIMSHDFVESALMRRAGYGVWLAYDLQGSYEQSPPSLIDELVRDRRWCQGNLQHTRLVFTRGFFPTHRALFINGIMSYVSALLWFLFLVASSAQAIAELFIVPDYFPETPSLFPNWPTYFPHWALTLFSGTATLLFLPKFFAVILVAIRRESAAFGGFAAMCGSVLVEVIISTFLAPVRMLSHTVFVLGALLGKSWGWNTQNRDDSGTSWSDALRFHWKGTVLGAGWGALMYLMNPGFFYWMSPIVAGLVLAVPLSVLTSRVSLGRLARRLRLFLTPVDTRQPKEVRALEQNLRKPGPFTPFPLTREDGFVRAVVVPRVFALHMALTRHARKMTPEKRARLENLAARMLEDGPDQSPTADKITVLSEPECLDALHRAVWTLPPARAGLWGIR
ncbi:glucans biosynthesis glucosyltransferase MdoH [Desulfovibrio sp. OttesenSCG-928-I05]|nr:glucans biosynthesis glucosyltransferase MdoH [Desulfovibrio sp. OttesenSCG-928-I05]